MKKIKLFKLLALFVVLITSINTAWAGQYNHNWYGNVFFRAPDNWDLSTNSKVQVVITRSSTGASEYVCCTDMSQVGSTRLYYAWISWDHSSWKQNEYLAFIANSSKKSEGTFAVTGCTCYTAPYDYGVNNSDCPYLFTPGSEGNNASLSGTCYTNGSNYGDRMPSNFNVSQTVNLYTNGSSSKTGGSVNVATYQMTGNTTMDSGGNTDNSTASVSRNAGVGSTVTLTASAASGYAFDGWYTAGTGGSLVSSSNPYSYTCHGATTVYARFKTETTYTITIANNVDESTSSASVGATPVQITAPDIEGYRFTTWSAMPDGVTKTSGNLTDKSIYISATKAATVTANYAAKTRITLYYSNPSSWNTVYAYVWNYSDDSDHNAAWSSNSSQGVNITSNTITRNCKTYYYYSYYYEDHTGWNRVIFSNNTTSAQTSDITYSYSTNNNQYNNGTHGTTGSWTALPAAVSYTVTVNTESASKGTVSPTSGTANNVGCALNIQAYPTTYYLFDHWTDDANTTVASTSTNPTTVTATNNGTVTAYFKDKWCVTGSGTTGMGNWSTDVNGLTNTSGTTVRGKVSISAKGDYTFKIKDRFQDSDHGWYANGETISRESNSTTTDLSTSGGNMTFKADVAGDYYFAYDVDGKDLTVTYPEAYAVTYEAVRLGGSGTAWSDDPTAATSASLDVTSGDMVLDGSTVTFTAQSENTGYTFQGWYSTSTPTIGTTTPLSSDDDADENKYTYTTDVDGAAVTVYAIYTENDYTVTVNAGTGGKVNSLTTTTVTGHKTTQADLPTATADPGYYFVNWTTDVGTLTNDESATTGKINGLTSTATVTANFAPIWRVACSSDSHNTESHQITTITASAGVMTSGSVTIDLNANTDYDLKIFNKPNNTWWGHSGDVTEITYTNKATAHSLAENTGSNQTFHTAGKGTYTFTWDVTNSKISIGYPTSYTVTFGEGTGNGTAVTASVESSGAITSGQYAAAGKDITFSQDAHEGYTFAGWYTASSGGTTVTGMSTSDHVYDDIATDISVYAQYTANNYTVTFNAGSGTCGTASKSVTYGSAYGTLPTATPPGDDKFIGWYTTATDAPVVGTRITAETTVSTADDHILYARYETTYEVIVQFKCGSDVLYPQTKVNASESSLSPTITAPEIFGYNFSGWTETSTSYVTYSPNAAASTATITATGSATIVANYTVVPTVYFKNNLGWENVYVTFDNTWSNSAPCNNGKPYFQMTQIGSSDIFYCEIPSTYTASDYAGWAWNIAFDNTGFSASENVGAKSGGFDEGEFVGRGDFDPKATMFIPYNGETETRNGGTYYPTGCWIQYNTNYSGYKVRVNTYVQGSGGTETANVELRSSIAGSTEFTATANLTNANFTYGFMLWKEHLKNTNDTLYTNVNDEENTITSATTSLPWAFEPCTGTWQRCRIHTEATGDYKFIVSFATGKPMVDIEYPVVVGDWKLIYKDRATWSNDAHPASWCHPSRVIKAKVDALDTISFFVAYGSTPSIELYKCTAIDPSTSAQTWTKQDDVSLTGITANGYYNFLVTQNGSKVVTSVTNLGAYSGNFYIRTDASDGGWSNYKSSKNEMTYSEYADTKKDFTHYFMRYVTSGSNIKFCIANDYNECISDTLEGDSYSGQYMAADGNVRFMWEKSTNTISRAYISGSSTISDRFLVLEGDAKMFNESGTALTTGNGRVSGLNEYEMNFTDDQNWVYEATIKAQPTAAVKLTAKFNDKIQYFYGAEGERDEETTHVIIGGNEADETKYKLRIVYDFKIDRLVSAFLPEDAINSALAIDADMMIIRDHQEGANQVTFGAKGSLSEVHTVYGAMKFNKYTVNNKLCTGTHGNAGLSPYERGLYWISFPFDVKLGDVFGFGTYYTHWAIEYYDGQERARDGYWADSDGFWKLVPKSQLNTFTLKAFEGYVLALDLDAMTESSSVWNNGVENVYLYFPSDGDVENISATELTVPISQDGYVCTIDRRTDKETPNTNKDRRIMDSYWHIIGTPSFADYSTTLYDVEGGTAIDWTTGSLPYLYVWNKSTNAYAISSSANHSFLAMHSYMVQYSGTSIYWSSVNVTPASVAARVQDMPDTEYKLSLVKDSIEEDHTYVRMTDDVNVTTAFEFNFDVTKVTNSGQGNIWTVTSDVVPVAGSSQPHPLTTTIVPVGVKIAANGEYTFSMPDGTNGGDVWLIDNANSSRTNLGLMDYTVNLTAGTYEGRFSLEFPVQNVVTEIENAANANANANADDAVRKVFVGGRLYILRDGKAYDATGTQVR